MTDAPEPRSPLDRATLALAGILACADVDLLTRLAVAAALAALDDVQPPPPPLPESVEPVTPGEGIPRALAELRSVIDTATDVGDAVRAGFAAHELLQLEDLP